MHSLRLTKRKPLLNLSCLTDVETLLVRVG